MLFMWEIFKWHWNGNYNFQVNHLVSDESQVVKWLETFYVELKSLNQFLIKKAIATHIFDSHCLRPLILHLFTMKAQVGGDGNLASFGVIKSTHQFRVGSIFSSNFFFLQKINNTLKLKTHVFLNIKVKAWMCRWKSLVTSKTNWATLIVLHGIKTPCVRKMMTPSFEVLSMLF